jgi:hypothetical protein
MEGEMELVNYEKNKDELLVKVNGRDWNQLTDMVSGVCSIYSKLDETILGIDSRRAGELLLGLVEVLDKMNKKILEKADGQ